MLSSTLAARLPAMYCSATLAIEVSSTCMKVAIEITTATSQGLRSPAAERLGRSATAVRWPSGSSHLHGRHHRHAGADIDVGRLVEHDLDRHALHHLDEVAGGVFGRQQAEGRAAAGLDAVDVAA